MNPTPDKMGPRMLVLASASPRRRQLFGLLGLPFSITSAEIDESPRAGEAPGAYTERLSREKALAVGQHAASNAVLVAADTTVADGREILGKPADPAEARAMLQRLRGRTHQVYTALAVLDAATGRCLSDVAVTHVRMRAYSGAEIEAYIATGDPFDKAGGYAIQHREFHPASVASGCYSTVVGLPLCHLVRLLRQVGLEPAADAPVQCQRTHGIECADSDVVLNALR